MGKQQLKQLRNNKGFTLVEMLVVLALVAVVAGLAFSVMGDTFSDSSIKAAATKVGDDMRQVSDASKNYQAQKASNAAATSDLVTGGYLTMMPSPPSQSGGGSYVWDTATYTNTWKTAAADTVVTYNMNNKDSVCKKINELFNGAAEGAAIPAAIDGTKDMQCFGTAGGAVTAAKLIYAN